MSDFFQDIYSKRKGKEKTRIYATSRGVYEAYLNGERIGAESDRRRDGQALVAG